MTKVGFIGLGAQGAPIARRIARGGFELVVCDRSPHALAAFDEAGVRGLDDPIALARAVDVLCVCVRTDEDLRSLAGDGPLFEALGPDGVFVIHSTVSPDLCRTLASEAAVHGVGLVDAGVSGGAEAALAGALLVVAGGEVAAFDRARPVMATYGDPVIHLGPVGRGMEAKLINNLVSIANYELAAATLELGERLGFDPEGLRQALLAGSAGGFAMRVVPRILEGRGGSLRNLLKKDYEHAVAMAQKANAPLGTLAPAAEALLERLR